MPPDDLVQAKEEEKQAEARGVQDQSRVIKPDKKLTGGGKKKCRGRSKT